MWVHFFITTSVYVTKVKVYEAHFGNALVIARNTHIAAF